MMQWREAETILQTGRIMAVAYIFKLSGRAAPGKALTLAPDSVTHQIL